VVWSDQASHGWLTVLGVLLLTLVCWLWWYGLWRQRKWVWWITVIESVGGVVLAP
jgi:hypothetical protein